MERFLLKNIILNPAVFEFEKNVEPRGAGSEDALGNKGL